MNHWAEAYLGKPWESGASGPQAYDCYGVVRAVYRDRLDIGLPVVTVDAQSARSVVRAVRDYDHTDWEEIEVPGRDFDVCEMTLAHSPHHVGVYLAIDGGGVLTALEGIGVVFQPLASLARHGWTITNSYRRRP